MGRYLFIIVLLVLSSCASFTEKHSRTLLMNRSTGEREECMVDKWRTQQSYDTYKMCIKTFEDQGYTIWSQY